MLLRVDLIGQLACCLIGPVASHAIANQIEDLVLGDLQGMGLSRCTRAETRGADC